MSMKDIQATLDRRRQVVEKKFLKEQIERIKADNPGLSDEDINRLVEESDWVKAKNKAIITGSTVKEFSQAHGSMGQVILLGLWEMYVGGYHTLIGEFDSLADWIESDMTSDVDKDYMKALGFAVERILAFAKKCEDKGETVTDPETGIEITAEYLIETKGLISKLKMYSNVFKQIEEEDDKKKFLIALVTKSRSQIREIVASMRGDDTDEEGSTSIRIPTEINKKDERFYVSFKSLVLDEDEYDVLMSKIGKYLDIA